jgi:aryl-alcohol dehydrogenase-like predicted oxidoreductase
MLALSEAVRSGKVRYIGFSGISQIVWSPLAQGVLTGKYLPGGKLPPDSRAANNAINGFLNQDWLRPTVLDAVQALRPLAAQAGRTLSQLADSLNCGMRAD